MTSGPLRLVIVAALAIVGVVVLTQGFTTVTQANVPEAASEDTGGGTQNPSPQPTKQQPKPAKEDTAPTATDPAEVRVAVYNGTTTPELAKTAGDDLQREGYVIGAPPDNTPDQNETTTAVYYRDAQGKIDAEALVDGFFKDATVEHLPATATQVPRDVDLAVYLGSDYAQAQQ